MTEDITKNELIRRMVGRDVLFDFEESHKKPGNVKYSISKLNAKNDKGLPAINDFSLDIREGEVLGLAGVDGNGQKELCEVLTGLRTAESGSIMFKGQDVVNRIPRYYIDQGLPIFRRNVIPRV